MLRQRRSPNRLRLIANEMTLESLRLALAEGVAQAAAASKPVFANISANNVAVSFGSVRMRGMPDDVNVLAPNMVNVRAAITPRDVADLELLWSEMLRSTNEIAASVEAQILLVDGIDKVSTGTMTINRGILVSMEESGQTGATTPGSSKDTLTAGTASTTAASQNVGFVSGSCSSFNAALWLFSLWAITG